MATSAQNHKLLLINCEYFNILTINLIFLDDEITGMDYDNYKYDLKEFLANQPAGSSIQMWIK